MNTDLIGIINLLSGILQISIGALAYFSDRESKIKKYYFLSAFFLGAWSLSLFFYSNPFLFDSTIWLKIVYTFAYAMTLGLILFAKVYPKEDSKRFRYFFWIIFLLMSIELYFLWFTKSIVIDTQYLPSQFNSLATMGRHYILYAIPELITAIYIVRYYIKQSKTLIGIEKRQVQYYFVGGIIMLLPVILFDFVLPILFNNTTYYKYSTVGNTIWTLLVGYSILKTRFLDIRVVIGSLFVTFTKAFLVTLSFGTVLIFAYITELKLNGSGILKIFLLSIPLGILLTKLFSEIENFFTKSFIYINYHPIKTLQEYNRLIAKSLKLSDLLINLAQTLKSSFKSKFIISIILDKERKPVSKVHISNPNLTIEEISKALEIWYGLNSNRVIIYSELLKTKRAGKRMLDDKRNSILTFMKENDIEIMFPIEQGMEYTGVILIGSKEDMSSYTITDIKFLESIIQSTQIALERAFLYKDVEDFSNKLQQKVNEQTQELQIKVKQLEEARRKEADMIDIMGHELRTPATVVKLNVELLERNISKGDISLNKYIERVKEAIDNEIKLINTLLTSAKLEGNKIVINKEEIDIKDEIEMSLHAHEHKAQEKGLDILNKVDINTPSIYADKARTVEILNNLISNAVKYTQKGSVTIESKFNKDFVTISVIDTGQGIPKDEIARLGKKFHRVENYIDPTQDKKLEIVRPGGTGLGLFVTFGLVEKMGGDIWVESEVDRGSNFTFSLPRYNGEENMTLHTPKSMFERLGLKK